MLLDDTGTPGSDDWCVTELAKKFGAGLPRLYELRSHVDGTALLPINGAMSASQREAYLRFVRRARLTIGDTAVKARVNRRKVLGFRTAAPGDLLGDAAAMANWTRSKMKVGSKDLFTDEATYGTGYLVMSGPVRPSADARPMMIRISPWGAISEQSSVEPWLTEYGATFGYDPVGQVDVITLYRPGYIRVAVREAKSHSRIPSDGKRWTPGRGWAWTTDGPVPLGYTRDNAMVQFSGENGKGIFEAELGTLERINHGILERLTVVAMQAFRQRAIEGKLPKVWPADHPQAGQTIDYDELFSAGPAALWMLPEGAKVWESAVTDTTPLIAGSKFDVTMFAANTGTPLYTLMPDANNVAAGAADLAREGIVFAVEDQNERDEVPIALAQSLNFQALGDTVRSDPDQIEVIWKSVARLSLAEQAQAAAQAKAGGMSQRLIDERIWQLSPSEIAQARQDRSDEAFEAAVPTPAPTGA
jgi:hypothetical protein